VRLIQISDTHVSANHRFFAENLEATTRWLRSEKARLFVHTGDLGMDAVGQEVDLHASRDWLAGLGAPTLCVPGNHDVGDRSEINPRQPVSDDRLRLWRDAIGPDRWVIDRDGWRLMGLNAMLLGTGHAEEEVQYAWIDDALDTDLPVAIFLHKPLFIDTPDEAPRGYWSVAPQPRQRLLASMQRARVKLVASGHLHMHRQRTLDGISYVWCPASSFVCGESQEELGGERRLGAVVHDFGADTVTSSFVRPEGLNDLKIEPVQHILYPR
jgi:3',5'-cyclic AMP phosphodiesterase CpdA